MGSSCCLVGLQREQCNLRVPLVTRGNIRHRNTMRPGRRREQCRRSGENRSIKECPGRGPWALGWGGGYALFFYTGWIACECQFVTLYFAVVLNKVGHAFSSKCTAVGLHCTSVTVGTMGRTRLDVGTH